MIWLVPWFEGLRVRKTKRAQTHARRGAIDARRIFGNGSESCPSGALLKNVGGVSEEETTVALQQTLRREKLTTAQEVRLVDKIFERQRAAPGQTRRQTRRGA